MSAVDTLAAVLAIAEKPPVGYPGTIRTDYERAFNEGVAVMAGQVRDLIRAGGGDRVAAALDLHQPVKHISGVTVCSTCFTEDEFPQVYPCRTRVLLGDAA